MARAGRNGRHGVKARLLLEAPWFSSPCVAAVLPAKANTAGGAAERAVPTRLPLIRAVLGQLCPRAAVRARLCRQNRLPLCSQPGSAPCPCQARIKGPCRGSQGNLGIPRSQHDESSPNLPIPSLTVLLQPWKNCCCFSNWIITISLKKTNKNTQLQS